MALKGLKSNGVIYNIITKNRLKSNLLNCQKNRAPALKSGRPK